MCGTSFFKKFFKKFDNSMKNIEKSLPKVRGKLSFNEPLAKKNWFGVGGSAQIYFEPADIDDLKMFLSKTKGIPFTILGAGSNVLIRDGGILGITIRLGKAFSNVEVKDDLLICKAGTMVMEVSRVAEKNCLSGFEFLCGIPGTVGGGIRMNAGAYGSSMHEILKSLTVLTKDGKVQCLEQEELAEAFSYRRCYLPNEWIFLEAVFQGKKEPNNLSIQQKMQLNRQKREAGQPMGVRTAGSTFKNPEGIPAWQLIERAGMRQAKVGGACVSDKHANFLINTGKATAKDIEQLGETIRQKVFEKEGILLEWEVRKLGVEDE